jgi:FecR protein
MQNVITYSFKSTLQLCFFCLACFSMAFSSSVFAADLAGRIIMARGEVQAINEAGETRKLKRRDSIFSHEIIKTGKKSKVQIRFIDNALLALKENSELNIKAYVYSEANEKNNQVFMELVAGGFRTLTGKIGKGNKAAYKVNTPVASIGIRGTLYDVQISLDKILAGVWKGGISLDSQQGQFNLGVDANFDFGEISANGEFTGLLSPPAEFTPPIPQQKQQDQDKKSPVDESREFKTDNRDDGDTAPPPINPDTHLTETDNRIPSPFEKDEAPNQEAVENDDNFNEDTEQPNPDPDPNPEPDPNPTPEPDPDPDSDSSPDLRLNNNEIDQLSTDPKLAILLSENGQRVAIALNTDGTGDNFFLGQTTTENNDPAYETLRRGNAGEADFSSLQPWSDQVNWGIWQGTSETPIERYTEYDNDTDFIPLEKDLFYMIVTPANQTELSSGLVSGRFSSSTSSLALDTRDYIASASNGGLVTDVITGFDLTTTGSGTFNITNIGITVEVDANPNDSQTANIDQTWSLTSSTGQVNSSAITVDDLTGTLIDNNNQGRINASGDITGLLAAPAINGGAIDTFAGGFNLSTDDGSENVGGVIILQTGQ